MRDKVKAFFLSNWSLSEKSLLLADVLLLGILIGWLTSPLKNGWSILSNNFRSFKTNTGCAEEEKESEEEA